MTKREFALKSAAISTGRAASQLTSTSAGVKVTDKRLDSIHAALLNIVEALTHLGDALAADAGERRE